MAMAMRGGALLAVVYLICCIACVPHFQATASLAVAVAGGVALLRRRRRHAAQGRGGRVDPEIGEGHQLIRTWPLLRLVAVERLTSDDGHKGAPPTAGTFLLAAMSEPG